MQGIHYGRVSPWNSQAWGIFQGSNFFMQSFVALTRIYTLAYKLLNSHHYDTF